MARTSRPALDSRVKRRALSIRLHEGRNSGRVAICQPPPNSTTVKACPLGLVFRFEFLTMHLPDLGGFDPGKIFFRRPTVKGLSAANSRASSSRFTIHSPVPASVGPDFPGR